MSPSLASDPSTHAAHSFGRDTGVLTARSRGVYICSSPNEELRAQGHEPQPLSCRCSGPGEVSPRDRSLQSGVADTVLGGLSTGTQAWANRTRARRRTAAEIISGALSKSFPDRNGEETSTEKCSFNSSFSIKFLAGWARVRTPSRRSSRSTRSQHGSSVPERVLQRSRAFCRRAGARWTAPSRPRGHCIPPTPMFF